MAAAKAFMATAAIAATVAEEFGEWRLPLEEVGREGVFREAFRAAAVAAANMGSIFPPALEEWPGTRLWRRRSDPLALPCPK